LFVTAKPDIIFNLNRFEALHEFQVDLSVGEISDHASEWRLSHPTGSSSESAVNEDCPTLEFPLLRTDDQRPSQLREFRPPGSALHARGSPVCTKRAESRRLAERESDPPDVWPAAGTLVIAAASAA